MTSQTTLVHSSALSLGDSLLEMTPEVIFLIISLQVLKMIFSLATAWMPENAHAKALKTLEALTPHKKSKEPPCCKKKDL